MFVALQLCSIGQEASENLDAALEMVVKAGYNAVEFAGHYGISASETKALLQKHGLTAVSAHVQFNAFRDDFAANLQYAKDCGYDTLICPWTEADTLEQVMETARVLEECAKVAAKEGVTVGYHNHSQQFNKFDGKYALEIMLEAAPSVKLQPDLYWVAYAGVSPLEYIAKYAEADRICSVHAKDLAKVGKDNVYVGEGVIDFAGAAKLLNPEKIPFIVEQEDYTQGLSHFDGISKSSAGLKAAIS